MPSLPLLFELKAPFSFHPLLKRASLDWQKALGERDHPLFKALAAPDLLDYGRQLLC